MIFYSDGLVERRGEAIDTGLQRLADAAVSGPSDVGKLCEHVLRRMLDAGRLQLHDDVTAMLVRVG